MKQQRLKLIAATATIFVFASVTTVLFILEIMKESRILREQMTVVLNDQKQQNQLAQLEKLLSETEADRTELSSYYLATQSDSIDFLNYVELLAEQQGVAVEDTRPREESVGTSELLVVQYSLEGSRPALERFIALLEVVPYVSEVTSISLDQQTVTTWGATVTVVVVVLDSV